MSNRNWVSFTETLDLTPPSSTRPRTRMYSRTSDSASALDVVLSPKWSKVAAIPARLSSRIVAIASSMFSPAIKRRVTWLNPGSFEKKSFSSVFCERYKRAALEIMHGSVIRKLSFRSGLASETNFITRAPVSINRWSKREIRGYNLRRNIPERKTTTGYNDGYTFDDCPDALPGWRVLF